ncbi:MAG: gamma-glutamyl-gamma-aminobutyrate hydrolase family protein [Chloroflexota bacterium]
MIVFVDNEHVDSVTQPWWERAIAARVWIKYRLEEMTGDHCLIMRYNKVTPDVLRELNVRALFLSGNGADADTYPEADVAGLRAAFREKQWPTFGFCGGFQLMSQTYGATLERIGALEPGEPDTIPNFAPGMKKEFGYDPVEITQSHQLLEGLGPNPTMRQAHSWEIKDVPDGFDCYASSPVTPIQMIIHRTLPIVGTQFHPEYYTDEHPAGRTLIENFCKMAGLI